MRLTLVRHGESQLAVHGHGTGLTETGVEQAEISGKWIKENLDPHEGYCVSPYARAVLTAVHLGINDAMWKLEPLLIERSWGHSNESIQDRRNSLLEDAEPYGNDVYSSAPPAGESESMAAMRFLKLYDRLSSKFSTLLVSHAEFMWIARAYIEQQVPVSYNDKASENGWVTSKDDRNNPVNEKIEFAQVISYEINYSLNQLSVISVCPWKSTVPDEYSMPILLTNEQLLGRVE